MPSKKFNWVQMIPTGVVLAVAIGAGAKVLKNE